MSTRTLNPPPKAGLLRTHILALTPKPSGQATPTASFACSGRRGWGMRGKPAQQEVQNLCVLSSLSLREGLALAPLLSKTEKRLGDEGGLYRSIHIRRI